MSEDTSLKMLKEFYDLHRQCVKTQEDFEYECEQKIISKYPQIKKFWVDNDYFSTSCIYVLPLSEKLVALCYLDQYGDKIVRINVSPGRLNSLIVGLQEVANQVKS